jgi:hypothetical protein
MSAREALRIPSAPSRYEAPPEASAEAQEPTERQEEERRVSLGGSSGSSEYSQRLA